MPSYKLLTAQSTMQAFEHSFCSRATDYKATSCGRRLQRNQLHHIEESQASCLYLHIWSGSGWNDSLSKRLSGLAMWNSSRPSLKDVSFADLVFVVVFTDPLAERDHENEIVVIRQWIRQPNSINCLNRLSAPKIPVNFYFTLPLCWWCSVNKKSKIAKDIQRGLIWPCVMYKDDKILLALHRQIYTNV